jgi:hypothetical protein
MMALLCAIEKLNATKSNRIRILDFFITTAPLLKIGNQWDNNSILGDFSP